MFSLFARKTAPVAAAPEFIQVRSRYGVAFHIVPNSADVTSDVPALCGYTNWVFANDSQLPAEEDVIRATLLNQHAGFRYCITCVSHFLGTTPEDLL